MMLTTTNISVNQSTFHNNCRHAKTSTIIITTIKISLSCVQ